MGSEEFDTLPFGTIKLDANNQVVLYNQAEAELARRKPELTVGQNFFTQVAPCTNTQTFRGHLEQMVAQGEISSRLDYKFLFPWGHRAVRIQFWVPNPGERWIFVLPM